MKKAFFWTAIRFALAAVFLWAGLAKLADPQVFADGIAAFQFFPDRTVNLLALSVPVLEMATAALLLSGRWQRQGALLAALLSAVFVFLFAWVALQGREIHCACFGSAQFPGQTTQAGLARGVLLLATSLALWRISQSGISPSLPPAGLEGKTVR